MSNQVRMAIYCRNVWQGLEWLKTSTGRDDLKVNVTTRVIEVANLRVRTVTAESKIEHLMGLEFDLIIFLDPLCPIEIRNFLMTRWR